MQEIDEADYAAVLQKLAADKWQLLKSEQHINRQVKTVNYLLQKGYEPGAAQQAVKAVREKQPL